jgi:hypothetical protein
MESDRMESDRMESKPAAPVLVPELQASSLHP